MNLSLNLTLVLIGGGIGFGAALVGGFLEYWFSLRENGGHRPRRLPGCMIYTAGGLAVGGIAAAAISLLVNGEIGPALTVGVGVVGGFFVGFVILFGVWLIVERVGASGE